MSDGPPPAKRKKYNLTKSFDVLVGKEPEQQRFTVYHDLVTQRSEFFRAARSERWNPDPTKPTTLDDAEVEVFSAYLHCVNFGAESLDCLVESMTSKHSWYTEDDEIENNSSKDGDSEGDDGDDDDSSSAEGGKSDTDSAAPGAADTQEVKVSGDVKLREEVDCWPMPVEKFLIDLYLLADKLIDPITANLVIDKLTSLFEKQDEYLVSGIVEHVYGSTTEASPLRKLVRDYSMIDGSTLPMNFELYRGTKFPHDFVRDILLQLLAINRENPDESVRKVYCRKSLQSNRYHQAIDRDLADAEVASVSNKDSQKKESQ